MKNNNYKQTEIGEIPENWSFTPFREVAYLSKEVFDPKKAKQDESSVYLGLEHFCEGGFALNGVGKSDEVQSNKFKFVSGDVLFGKLRPYFKKIYSPKFDGVCSTDIWVLRAKQGVDQKFLYFLVGSDTFLNKAVESSEGTKMPRASWDFIANYKFPIPSFNEQQQIASILSSLDDKIGLNREMNKTLEEIEKALFKRWFVDFEFPYDDGKPYKSSGGKMVDSELGEIPERWKVGEIGQLCKVKSGFAFQSSVFQQTGEYGVIKIKNIIDPEVDLSEVEFVNEELLRSKAKEFILVPGDTLIAMSGNTTGKIGLMSQTTNKYVLNQRFGKYFFNEEIYKWFIYLFLRNGSTQQNIVQTAYGSAQPNISPSILEGVRIAIPERIIFEKFYQLVNPIMTLKIKNWGENSFLAQIRDSLLPRLMSGKLRVRN